MEPRLTEQTLASRATLSATLYEELAGARAIVLTFTVAGIVFYSPRASGLALLKAMNGESVPLVPTGEIQQHFVWENTLDGTAPLRVNRDSQIPSCRPPPP